MAIASGLNIYRGDSFTFEMNIFTYAKNLSLRRDVSELVASSFGGARGEEAGRPSDQWEPCFENPNFCPNSFEGSSKIVAHFRKYALKP